MRTKFLVVIIITTLVVDGNASAAWVVDWLNQRTTTSPTTSGVRS